MGHDDRRSDLVRGDLPPARPGTRSRGAGVRRLPGHDPSRTTAARSATAIEAAIDGIGAVRLDFRVVWPDGSIHWTHGAGRIFATTRAGRPDDRHRPGHHRTTTRSRTQRDRLLDDERRAGEFREAFIDVISHELRTPITTILGLTQILARPGRTDDAASRMALLEDVRAESERLHRLVEDLLVLSRVERGRLVVRGRAPRSYAGSSSASSRRRRRSCRRINVETGSSPTCRSSPARRPTSSRSCATCWATRRSTRRPGHGRGVDARRGRQAVEIRVTDAGPGDPGGSLRRVFELFYRDPDSARAVAGSGIGLFVCRSLVEAMGGRIWARRPEEGGTEFGFSLRVLESDPSDDHEWVAAKPPTATVSAPVAAPDPTPALSEGTTQAS